MNLFQILHTYFSYICLVTQWLICRHFLTPFLIKNVLKRVEKQDLNFIWLPFCQFFIFFFKVVQKLDIFIIITNLCCETQISLLQNPTKFPAISIIPCYGSAIFNETIEEKKEDFIGILFTRSSNHSEPILKIRS